MRKGVTSKQQERAMLFTKEVFGMGLLLFSVLSLLCVLTGDSVFYTLGKGVQGFFMGAFGYYSFYVIFGFIVFGLKLVIGRPIFSDDARHFILRLGALAFSVMAIIQIATRYSRALNYSEFFSLCYGGGVLNLSNSTPLGALSSIVIFPLCKLASSVGAYIFFALAIIITVLLLVKSANLNRPVSRSERPKTKPASHNVRKLPASRLHRVTNQTKQFDGSRAREVQGEFETPSASYRESQAVNGANAGQKRSSRPAYISGDFGIKSKRDYQRPSAPPDLLMGDFEFNNSKTPKKSTGNPSYSSTYSPFNGGRRSSLSPEAQHILTPPEFNPADLNDTPMRGAPPRDYGNRGFNRAPAYDKSASEQRSYSTNRDNDVNDYLDRRFSNQDRQAGQGRRGLFDNTIEREDNRPETRIPNPMDIPGEQEIPRAMRGDAQTYSTSYNSEAKEIPNVEKAYNPLKNQGVFDATQVARNRGIARQTTDSEQTDATPRFARPSADRPYGASRFSREPQSESYDQPINNESSVEQVKGQQSMFDENNFESERPSYTRSRTSAPRTRADNALAFDGATDNSVEKETPKEVAPPTYKESDGSQGSVYVEAPPSNDVFPEAFTVATAERTRPARAETPARATSRTNDYDGLSRTNVNADILSNATASKAQAVSEDDDDDKEHGSIDQMPFNYKYRAPSTELLADEKIDKAALYDEHNRLRQLAMSVVENFAMRNVKLTLENIEYGMTITRFEYSIPTSTQLKLITSAQGDIALWLHAKGDIRIIPQLPGTSRIGIEVPNEYTTTVRLRNILKSPQCKELSKKEISITVGKDVMGKPVFLNLTSMPHLLIAGATGTGKSVFLNSMLLSWLYTYSPEDLRIVIVDPKQLEFVDFLGVPHLLFNKVITEAEEAAALLQYMTEEMDRRYTLFRDARVKKIKEYNDLAVQNGQRKLPYLVVLIDEFADLMMATPQVEKSMTASIKRLAQLARAAGISLIFATQRPSADVISGAIKTNFTARICFKTSDYTNSQVVLGENGAEKLLGKGDLIYKVTGASERAQGALVESEEIRAAVEYIQKHNKCYYDKTCLANIKKNAKQYNGEAQEMAKGQQMSMEIVDGANLPPAARDVFYRRAVRVVILFKTASKSILQTKIGIGFNRAAKFIDWMEADGFVSYPMDNKQRQILIDRATYEQVFNEPFNEDYTK